MEHILTGRVLIMRQTKLSLSKRDRRALNEVRSKGTHTAREVNRAHILAALDCKVSENQIMEVLGVSRTVIWRTRSAYLQEGLDFALKDVPRPGKPKRYQINEEAQITALACSNPPAGAARWTIALLMEAARTQSGMESISRETIRRFLKKTSSNPGAS